MIIQSDQPVLWPVVNQGVSRAGIPTVTQFHVELVVIVISISATVFLIFQAVIYVTAAKIKWLNQKKVFNAIAANMVGNSPRDQRSNRHARSSFSFFARVEVRITSTRLAKTSTVADRIKKSSRVRYETLGKSVPTAKRYAIRVSMLVMATLI